MKMRIWWNLSYIDQTDYDKARSSKQIRGATFSDGIVWTRVKSTDYGETWKIINDILGKNKSKLNVVYRSVSDVDGSVIAEAQNYARILKF